MSKTSTNTIVGIVLVCAILLFWVFGIFYANRHDQNSHKVSISSTVQQTDNVVNDKNTDDNLSDDNLDNENSPYSFVVDYLSKQILLDSKKYIPRSVLMAMVGAINNTFDPLLMYSLIYVESHFDPFARSKTGAVGCGQVKYKFWKDKLIEANIIEGYRDMFDPVICVEVAEYVLKEQMRRYQNIKTALVHYYCGNLACATGKRYAGHILAKYGELVADIKQYNVAKNNVVQ